MTTINWLTPANWKRLSGAATSAVAEARAAGNRDKAREILAAVQAVQNCAPGRGAAPAAALAKLLGLEEVC
jgi:hypothetical protein